MEFPRATQNFGDCIQIVHAVNRKITKDNYPLVNHEGERWFAHRLSFHMNKKNIDRTPNSRVAGFVLHKCDNKRCINPEHLYLGTAKQNVSDTFARHPDVRAKLSCAAKSKPRNPNFKFDWTGKKLSDASKKKISEKAKLRYSAMTPDKRQAHMKPAIENRWSKHETTRQLKSSSRDL